MTLEQFTLLIKELDNKNIYYISNFNRAPLFHCHHLCFYRYLWWMRGGHFSPIIGYIYDEKEQEIFVLIADTNSSYAHYMIPTHRLYAATKCKQINGKHRGLIRLEINKNNTRK